MARETVSVGIDPEMNTYILKKVQEGLVDCRSAWIRDACRLKLQLEKTMDSNDTNLLAQLTKRPIWELFQQKPAKA